ncbi:hypothetical protein [Psychromonas sp.]|uniref:hypothetical protein n=1 Tax=Psychromonas sp. TaxID=1884585 RepID=UPI0035625409
MNFRIEAGLLLFLLPAFTLANGLSPEQLYHTVGGYGCAACHGKYAHGGGYVGGNIRAATREQLDNALQTEPSMLLLAEVLDENKRNLLSSYLAELGQKQLVEWRIGESDAPKAVKIKAGDDVQLVIFNGTFERLSVDLSALDAAADYQIDAYDTHAITWSAKAGDYLLSVNNEHFTINVD